MTLKLPEKLSNAESQLNNSLSRQTINDPNINDPNIKVVKVDNWNTHQYAH